MDPGLICLAGFCVTVTCLCFTDVLSWFKKKFYKNVQCWFCHVGSRVKYIDANSWTCTSCGQYNGFQKDGDYNREIPGQYDARLNRPGVIYTQVKRDFRRDNQLCSKCNYNQELKIKQLASFVPLSEHNYDKEIQHYKRQLEESYKLCDSCELLVSKVISSHKNMTHGPRRLALFSKKFVFKSYWTLYTSIVLSLLMLSNRVLSVFKLSPHSSPYVIILSQYLRDIRTFEVISGLGVILHTVKCCQFGTYWSFIDWLAWSVISSCLYFIQDQNPVHLIYVQVGISLCFLLSNCIILIRKKRLDNNIKMREEEREKRRIKLGSNTDTVMDSKSSLYHYNSLNLSQRSIDSPDDKRDSPVRLSSSSTPKSESKSSEKRKILKPVPQIPQSSKKSNEDLDISSLSISNRDVNNMNKCVSPWDKVTVTRSSSFSSGVSSLRSSPCSFKTSQNYIQPSLFSNTNGDEWFKSPSAEKQPYFNRRNDPWTPIPDHYDSYKKPLWPSQMYPYPVAYTWPNMTPVNTWDNSVTSSPGSVKSFQPNENTVIDKQSNFLNHLPTIILAATNAFLVYYILHIKS